MDPDPRHPGMDPGSGFWKMIQILADPDPQHCMEYDLRDTYPFLSFEAKIHGLRPISMLLIYD
jgi:hypothetical protein